MRTVCALLGTLVVSAALARSSAADLPEPPKNEGATQVRVDGTRVSAEAWAVAHGREVEAVVVTRLVPQVDRPPKVETYERWSLDGRKKLERGDKELGKAWEKHLWALLADLEEGAKPGRGKRRDALDRLLRAGGRGGAHVVGDWVVGWSLGQGVAEKGGRRSVGRTAVFTFTPAPREPETTPGPEEPKGTGAVTPRKEKPQAAARGGDAPQKRAPRSETPVTPGSERPAPMPRPLPRRGMGGTGGSPGIASSSGVGQASSEDGVREHACVVVDLRRLTPPPRKPERPRGDVTPRHPGR